MSDIYVFFVTLFVISYIVDELLDLFLRLITPQTREILLKHDLYIVGPDNRPNENWIIICSLLAFIPIINIALSLLFVCRVLSKIKVIISIVKYCCLK